jgi:hypothetical protein
MHENEFTLSTQPIFEVKKIPQKQLCISQASMKSKMSLCSQGMNANKENFSENLLPHSS